MENIKVFTVREFFNLWKTDPATGIRSLLVKINIYSLRTALQDADFDGIPEGIEALLLEKFRPLYRFSTNNGKEEKYLPTDYMEYIRRSGMVHRTAEGDILLANPGDFADDPGKILRMDQAADGKFPTQIIDFHQRSDHRLFVNDSFYQGFDDGRSLADHWVDLIAKRNTGLYGHVVKDRFGNYKVEYWQFYAYNNADQDDNRYDHECDLEAVHLLVDAVTLDFISVSHFIHGKEIFFEKGETEPLFNGNIAEYRGPAYFTGYFDLNVKGAGGFDRSRNNLLRMHAETLPDGLPGAFTHPVVYIEYGGHASWPSEFWDYFGAPKHDGDSHTYLTALPPNLGEVEHPLSDDAQVILQFNGYWGRYAGPGVGEGFKNDNSPGAALHWSWLWPFDSMLRQSIPANSFE